MAKQPHLSLAAWQVRLFSHLSQYEREGSLTAAAVAFFKVPVPYALIVAGIIAIWWHRPRDKDVP